MQYLYRRNGTFHFRLRLPQDLSAKFGLRELRFSLGTRDFRTARLRAAAGRTAMEWLIFNLRHMDDESEDGPTLILTNGEIRQLARIYYEQQIEQDQNLRVHAGALGVDFTKIQATRPAEEARLRQAIGRGDIAAIKDLATDLVEANPPRASSVPFSVEGTSIDELCFMILRGKLEANLVAQARDKGEVNAATSDPLFLDSPETVSAPVRPARAEARPVRRALNRFQNETLDQALEAYLKERSLANKTINDYRNTIRWLKEVVGTKKIGDIEAADLIDFKEHLLEMPANAAQTFGTKSMKEAISLSKRGHVPYDLMTTATINNKYLSNLRKFFSWAALNGRTSDKTNPARDIRVEVNADEEGLRLPFPIEQLQILFNAPLFTGCQSEDRVHGPGNVQIRDYRFWVPLLSLFAGLRLNEIGQLATADVCMHNGLLHFRVIATSTRKKNLLGEAKAQNGRQPQAVRRGRHRKSKKLKSPSAYRYIPIHQELIKIGFLDYVQQRLINRDERLFPEWPKAKDSYFSSKYSRFFNQQLLPPLGIKAPELVFHSLRHNFKDALRNAAIVGETQNRAMGHRTRHVGAEYGSGTLVETESIALLGIQYKGLDLSRLHAHNPRQQLEWLPAPLHPALPR